MNLVYCLWPLYITGYLRVKKRALERETVVNEPIYDGIPTCKV